MDRCNRCDVAISNSTYEQHVGSFYAPVGQRGRHIRIVGNLEFAQIVTAADIETYLSSDCPWVPQIVPGRVTVDASGAVTISGAPSLNDDARAALEWQWHRALRESGLLRLESGRRYLAGWYVCLDRQEAERLALVTAMRTDRPLTDEERAAVIAEITVTEGVEIVHGTEAWALWSDGALTKGAGLPRWTHSLRRLPKAVAAEISAIVDSDSGAPEGGWQTLLEVAEITDRERVGRGAGRGPYAARRAEHLTCRLRNGGERHLWVETVGYFEGYQYEVTLSPPENLLTRT